MCDSDLMTNGQTMWGKHWPDGDARQIEGRTTKRAIGGQHFVENNPNKPCNTLMLE